MRKVTIKWPAEHLERQRGTQPVSSWFPPRNRRRCVSMGLFLLTNEKYLQPKWFVDHVRRGLNPAQMEITRTRQLVDPRLSGCQVVVVSPRVFLKVNLDFQRCVMCFTWMCPTTSDYKSNQAWMTHSRHNGNSWVSWRVYASVNGDYVDVVYPLKYTKACVSSAACELRTKLRAVNTLRQHLWRRRGFFPGEALETPYYKSSVGELRSTIPSLLQHHLSSDE